MSNIPTSGRPWSSGDNKDIVITVKDENGNAKDLTGYSVIFSLYKRGSLILSKTTASGITISTNVLTVSFGRADTADLEGTYTYECQVTDTLNNVTTLQQGTLTLTKDYIA